MKLAIFTNVPHIKENNLFYSYAPYVKEMNIWLKNVDEVLLLAPIKNDSLDPIHISYSHKKIEFIAIKEFNFLNSLSLLKAIVAFPRIFLSIFCTMKKADHIHLRCPGNVGLLACFVQILFPLKKKTAKYAGNWDAKSKQPLSYKLQKWILSNTFLTKNMQVLVYGEWQNQSKNIKSFFTATYFESDKEVIVLRDFKDQINFLFVGTLSNGKQPLYAIKLIQEIDKINKKCKLHIYGDGILKEELIQYVKLNNLENYIQFYGNQSQEIIKKAYQSSHFLILPSLSEGWPKVVAEAMFWGCLPVSTKVSCVPFMLGNGNRGILLSMNIETDSKEILNVISDEVQYTNRSNNAVNWSRNYTLDFFENEINILLNIRK